MAKEKKASKKNTVSAKKKILKTVTDQLNSSLTSLKGQLGEKKFKKRIKKAAKKLVAGIKKAPVKKAVSKTKKVTLLKPKVVKPAVTKPE
jgi:vacuolar-type H+-ATPase subunit E/Vma4